MSRKFKQEQHTRIDRTAESEIRGEKLKSVIKSCPAIFKVNDDDDDEGEELLLVVKTEEAMAKFETMIEK